LWGSIRQRNLVFWWFEFRRGVVRAANFCRRSGRGQRDCRLGVIVGGAGCNVRFDDFKFDLSRFFLD
jgi:hypothetical protein